MYVMSNYLSFFFPIYAATCRSLNAVLVDSCSPLTLLVLVLQTLAQAHGRQLVNGPLGQSWGQLSGSQIHVIAGLQFQIHPMPDSAHRDSKNGAPGLHQREDLIRA